MPRLIAKAIPGVLSFVLLFAGCGGHTFWTPQNSNNPTGALPKFAYVANFNNGGAGSVSGFKVDAGSGALASVTNSPSTAGTGTVNAGADSGGKFVYAANQDGTVSAYQVNRTDGTLSAITGSPFTAGNKPVWVAVDPQARFVYVGNSGSNDISGFVVNSTSGALTSFSGTVPAGGTPFRLTVDSGGRFLYVALGVGGTSIFKINTDGTLAFVRTATPAPCAGSFDITLDANSRFAYIADGSTGVCAYAVNASTGDLSLIGSAVTPSGTKPIALAVGALTKFLFVVNQDQNNLSGFLINTDGTLSAMTGSPFNTGATPSDVTVDPSGTFVYVSNSGVGSVTIFKISNNTLSGAGGATAGTNPSSVVVTQ